MVDAVELQEQLFVSVLHTIGWVVVHTIGWVVVHMIDLVVGHTIGLVVVHMKTMDGELVLAVQTW